MLAVPLFNMQGERLGEVEVDPAVFGGEVRVDLLKQAVVAHRAHARQWSARTKGRKHIAGSTRKLYRQKGTGNARVGNIRTPVRRGGGRTFAKRCAGSEVVFPKKMRRAARCSAVLAKIQAENVLLLDELKCTEPKTKVLASMFSALGIDRGCLLAMDGQDANVYRSGRNIPNTDIRVVDDLNAYEVLRRPKVVFTKAAFDRLVNDPIRLQRPAAQ